MIGPRDVREVFASPTGTKSADCVTVAISLFNYGAFIRECLDSVHAQTHQSLDLIVVDDASDKDDSLEIAHRWMREHQQRFRRCLLLQHACNRGLAETRNSAFRLAETEAVFVLDADNFIYPRAIARLDAALRGAPYGAAYSQLVFFGDQGRLGYADVWSKERFKVGNYVDAMSLVRADVWRRVDGYTHLEGGWEDYDFWCKCVENDVEAIFVPELLCCYRVHGSSMLRTDHQRHVDALASVMLIRHPWLDI